MFINLINNKRYIGQSKDIKKRIKSHLSTYKNSNSPSFNNCIYKAFRKYGIDNFEVKVIEYCNYKKLDEREEYWIAYYDTYNNGYNLTEGGQANDKHLHSEENQKKSKEAINKSELIRGENHPNARLSNKEVLEIRLRFLNEEPLQDIYKDYDKIYTLRSFKQIVYGYSYKDLGNIPSKDFISKMDNSRKGENNQSAKLKNEEVISIRTRFLNNENIEDIFEDYKDRYSNIDSFKPVVYCRSYKNIGNIELNNACIEKHRKEKYKSRSGEFNTRAKLTQKEVNEIRERYDNGETIKSIYKDYSDLYTKRSFSQLIHNRNKYKNIN